MRGSSITAGRDLVALIDDFLDDKLSYPLEWDDFVSWKNMDAGIESVRLRIESLEPLFLSASKEERNKATLALVEIRNSLALSHGMEERAIPVEEEPE